MNVLMKHWEEQILKFKCHHYIKNNLWIIYRTTKYVMELMNNYIQSNPIV